jgi:predicted metal-dependent hydrolase
MDQVPEYTLTRKRIKNLRLTVKAPDGDVVVSAPRHVPDAAIAAFVKDKAAWIQKHRNRLANQPRPLQAGPEAEAMRAHLKETVPPLVEYWAERMGLPMPTLAFRRMTSRWGSCNTQTKRITFNLELGRRDPELLEYVVVHELAHLIERGHNARFYAVMDEYLPEWRILRRVLNGSSPPAP